jgi:O-antigen/teichoic acid export membrane protein
MKSQLVEAFFAFAIRMSGGVASYALFAVISRTTGSTAFGAFSISFSLAMTAGLFGSFGQQVFFVKEVPKASAMGRPEIEKGIHIFALSSTLICSILAAFAVWGISVYGQHVAQDNLLVLSTAALAFLYAISQVTIGGLRVQDKVLYAMATRDLLWRALAIAAMYITYAFIQPVPRANLQINLIMIILATCLAPIVCLHLIHILGHMRRSYGSIKAKIEIREWIDTSLGLLLIAIISSSDLYIYTILLGNLVGKEEAGAFFASLKTVELLNMFLMAVTLVTAPEISRVIALGDRNKFQQACNKAILLQGVPAIAAAIFIIAAAPIFMGLFNPLYVGYSNLLRLLAFGMLFNALTGATVLILQLIGKHWLQVLYQGGSLLISIIMLPFLLKSFGIYGVAIAFIFSKLLWNALAIITIRKEKGVDPSLLGLFDAASGGARSAIGELGGQFGRGKVKS